MWDEVWAEGATDEAKLDRLRQYLQASSALSFAAHGQVFTDADLEDVHVRAGDYVSV